MPPTLSATASPQQVQDWVSGLRDEYHFPEVFRYAPMGVRSRAMMTLLIAEQSNNHKVPDTVFKFWKKPWNQRDCAVVDCYDGPGLTTATTAGGAAGATRVLAMTAVNTTLWEVGQHVVVTKFNDSGFLRYVSEAKGKVTGKTVNGDSDSYLTITLDQADSDNALSGAYLRANPAGQSHPNIHTLPESHVENPTSYDGAVSTFLGSYSMDDVTRMIAARNTNPNYNSWAECQADGMKDFAIDKEMAYLESVLDITTQNETRTGGMAYYLNAYQAQSGQNIINALTDTIYLSASTTGPAYTWIYEMLSGVMEYAGRWFTEGEVSCFHGGQVGLVINEMIRDKGTWNLGDTTGVDNFGFKFRRLTFQNGSIKFYDHPLFRNAARYQSAMIITDPANVAQATFSGLETIPADVENSERQKRAKRDGTIWSSVAKGGFREICGWKFNAIDGMFIIRNVHPQLSRT